MWLVGDFVRADVCVGGFSGGVYVIMLMRGRRRKRSWRLRRQRIGCSAAVGEDEALETKG